VRVDTNINATNTNSDVETKRARIREERSRHVVKPSDFAPAHISELLHKEFAEQEWLVEGLVPCNAVTIFSAAPGSLKTRTLLHLAVVAAKGEPLFGEFPTKQSGVLIVDEESGEYLLNQQLRQMGADDSLPILYRSFQNFKLNSENIELIKDDCRRYELKVVIFDSLIQIHNKNENEATDMAPVMNFLKQLAETGLTVLVIAHDRKTGINGRMGNSDLRGSSAILGGVDAHISMLKRKDRLTIEPTKLRHGLLHEAFEVIVTGDKDSCTFEYQGSVKAAKAFALKSAIKAQVQENGQLNQQDLLSRLNESGFKVGMSKLRDILNDMDTDKEIDWYKGTGKEKIYITPA
jgi:hypothetical protein